MTVRRIYVASSWRCARWWRDRGCCLAAAPTLLRRRHQPPGRCGSRQRVSVPSRRLSPERHKEGALECDLGPSLLLVGVVVDAVVVGSVAHLMIAKGAQPVDAGLVLAGAVGVAAIVSVMLWRRMHP